MDISVTNLSKTFYQKPVISNLDFKIKSGECVGIFGPNGSGKTTLLKMVSGIMSIDSGTISIGNQKISPENLIPRQSLYYVGHELGFYSGLTGNENLEFILNLYYKNPTILDDAIKRVGLENAMNKMVKFYSQGMKQRLKLLIATLVSSPILLLDEPRSGLDEDGINLFQSFLDEWKQDGKTCLIVSHDKEWLSQNTDRLLKMEAVI